MSEASSLCNRLPNLFILGAAKAGTTSIYRYLTQHPSIYLSSRKEAHFFSNDRAYARGLTWYVDTYFPNAQQYPLRIDATPAYFHRLQAVIPRLRAAYPDASPKFIIILREPASRAWSHYLHRVSNGVEPLEFEAAVAAEEERARRRLGWSQYFHDGLYARQLRCWFEHFPRENFHILLTDDLHAQPQDTLRKIFAFLEIEQDVSIETMKVYNQSAVNSHAGMAIAMKLSFLRTPRVLSNAMDRWFGIRPRGIMRNVVRRIPGSSVSPPKQVMARLRQAYREDILDLSKLIDRDLSHWL